MKYNNNHPEGYQDKTADMAVEHLTREEKITRSKKHVPAEDEKFYKFLDMFWRLCELMGYNLENRLIITDKKTGKVYR